MVSVELNQGLLMREGQRTSDVDGLVRGGDELDGHDVKPPGRQETPMGTGQSTQGGPTHAAKMHQSLESRGRCARRRASALKPQAMMAREVKTTATLITARCDCLSMGKTTVMAAVCRRQRRRVMTAKRLTRDRT